MEACTFHESGRRMLGRTSAGPPTCAGRPGCPLCSSLEVRPPALIHHPVRHRSVKCVDYAINMAACYFRKEPASENKICLTAISIKCSFASPAFSVMMIKQHNSSKAVKSI